MEAIKLPTKKRKAILETPKRMILFSKPKVGKTTIVSQLDNCLILDFEEGTLAIDALSYPINEISDIVKVCKAIEEAGKPYNYICVDTASALEEMAIPVAEKRFANSPEGDKWFLRDENGKLHPKSLKARYGSVMNLPYGKGYTLVADVFNDVLARLEKVAPKLILLAHSTYATLNKEGVEFTSLDIQMSKKCKFAATFKADAIGYIYRDGKQNFINFTATEDVGAGGRHRYLEKEHILISEYVEDENGNESLKTYWENIYKK
jgi:hypothetical protein